MANNTRRGARRLVQWRGEVFDLDVLQDRGSRAYEIEWARLVTRTALDLIGVFRGLGFSVQDAEDLSQDAYRRAMDCLDQVSLDKSFRGWLLAVARNLGRDALRSAKSHLAFDDVEMNEVPGRLADGLEYVLGKETAGAIDGAFEKLRPSERAAVQLHLQGFSHDESARQLGTSVANQKVYSSRGMAALRRNLDDLR